MIPPRWHDRVFVIVVALAAFLIWLAIVGGIWWLAR
jgi:hypothetical protein